MSYLLFPSSGNHVTLEPEWDYARKDAQTKNEHITRGGKRFVYKWGSYVRFSFGLTFINSSTAGLINSWWITNTKLLFMSTSETTVYSVMLIAADLPASNFQKPYTDKFTAVIELQGY